MVRVRVGSCCSRTRSRGFVRRLVERLSSPFRMIIPLMLIVLTVSDGMLIGFDWE